MRVLLDGTALLGRRFGIGYYAENLIHGLFQESCDLCFTVFLQYLRRRGERNHLSPCLPEGGGRFERRCPFFVSDWLYGRLGVPADRFLGTPDLFHGLRFFLPRLRRGKAVWTLFDLSFKVEPEWFPKETARRLAETTARNLDRADHVIAISENTRRDLIDLFDYPPDRVTAIPLGVPRHGAGGEVGSAKDEYRGWNGKRPYFLFVGTLEPRKNVERLIRAFSRLTLEFDLVLVGGEGWKYSGVLREIEKSPRKANIRPLGYVTAEEMRRLYREAAVFVYPSLYEGFGLPVAEALSHGLPVITSNRSSLPEVAGEAAVYVDPEDEEMLAVAMERVAENPDLRRVLCQKAVKERERLSWKETARKTIAVYKSVLGQGAVR